MEDCRLYAVIDCSKLQHWVGVDCMPICEFDEITYENIKKELSDSLGAKYLERVDYISEDTIIYAKGDVVSIGVTSLFGDRQEIFVQCSKTNATVVAKALQDLVSKFGSHLIELPNPLKF